MIRLILIAYLASTPDGADGGTLTADAGTLTDAPIITDGSVADGKELWDIRPIAAGEPAPARGYWMDPDTLVGKGVEQARCRATVKSQSEALQEGAGKASPASLLVFFVLGVGVGACAAAEGCRTPVLHLLGAVR